MKVVDFYLGYGSRYAYLAASQVDRLQAQGAEVRWLVVDSPRLIAAAGTSPFSGSPPSPIYAHRYRARDAERWAALYGIPIHEPQISADVRPALNALSLAAERLGMAEPVVRAVFHHLFALGRPLDAIEVLEDLAASVGLEPAALVSAPDTIAVHDRRIANALEAGVFGVPTFVYEGDAYFGNDRLPLLVHRLTRLTPP